MVLSERPLSCLVLTFSILSIGFIPVVASTLRWLVRLRISLRPSGNVSWPINIISCVGRVDISERVVRVLKAPSCISVSLIWPLSGVTGCDILSAIGRWVWI